jgi:hypothetical protein
MHTREEAILKVDRSLFDPQSDRPQPVDLARHCRLTVTESGQASRKTDTDPLEQAHNPARPAY